MSLFDKKSEVIDFQLTEYGVEKLSKGEMKPHSYAFFDSDILYDRAYASGVDSDGAAGLRIKERTARVKGDVPQMVVDGTQALGHSDPNSEFLPAWRVNLHSGDIVSFDQLSTGSYNERIPQVSSSFAYRTKVKKGRGSEGARAGFDPDSRFRLDDVSAVEYNSEKLSDGSFVEVKGEYLFAEIAEEGVIFEKENFEVEFFVREEEELANGETKEIWERLSLNAARDDENISTYFSVKFDDDIEDAIFCSKIDGDGYPRGVFFRSDRDCDSAEADLTDNFYRRLPQRNDSDEGDLC